MGSSSSKFRKALQRGEEVEAMQLYLKNPEIKRNLDPNYSYGENYGNDTILHYACLYGMKPFVRDFLSEGANPNKRNSANQTCAHLVCMSDRGQDSTVDKHRCECLSLLLCWAHGEPSDQVDLPAKDEKGNTALHYAASSGLLNCIQLLVAHGAPLYEENKENQTACDCAIQGNFTDIAAYLESKMVFSDNISAPDLEDNIHSSNQEDIQHHSGLCAQDLQEAKDQLLVETADMLMVPLFTAEALLRNHEWSREHLVEAWMADAKAACEKAGVRLPEGYAEGEKRIEPKKKPELVTRSNVTDACMICAEPISPGDLPPLALSCGHEACCLCWESYLNVKIKDGDAHNIQCPAYNCNTLVPLETIEKLVSKEMANRYLQFDIKAFVESNPNLKWCPAPRCGRAVRIPSQSRGNHANGRSLRGPRATVAETPCVVVDCGGGHLFCWECLQEVHEPCSCEMRARWLKRVAEMLPKIPTKASEIPDECPETQNVANSLWLVTNSKPCPNCKSPIQKTEGCNHMKCTKCKHEFCWVCLELWKKHSSATGGYFRCNRYEIVRKLDIQSVNAIKEANATNLRIQELNYFLHYYSRFKNHENSYKLEEPLLGAAKDKMTALAVSALETATSPDVVDTKFVEEAVRELLKARRVLKASYAYGFFLTGNKEKKTIFELMQTEVEEATETLSQMVARPYLRTPRAHIIQATTSLGNKRRTFLLALSRGLIPDEDPPVERLVSRLTLHERSTGSGDDDSDEGENNFEEVRRVIESSIRQRLGQQYPESSPDSTPPGAGIDNQCSRPGCSNPRASSRYTGQMSNYCCYDCLRMDMRNRRRRKKKQEKESKPVERAVSEEVYMDVDLMRAIQLSLDQQSGPSREQKKPRAPRPRSSSSSSSSAVSEEEQAQNSSIQQALEFSYSDLVQGSPDEDLKRAIALSLQDSGRPSETSRRTTAHARNRDSALRREDWDSSSWDDKGFV